MTKFVALLTFAVIFSLVAGDNDEKWSKESFEKLEKLAQSLDGELSDEKIEKYREKLRNSLSEGKGEFDDDDRKAFRQRIQGKLSEMKKKLENVLATSSFQKENKLTDEL